MGQEGGKSEPIQHLRDACFQYVVLLVSAPVACGKGLSHSISDSVAVEVGGKLELLFLLELVAVDVLLEQLLHVFDDLPKLLSEDLCHEPTCHIKAFLSVVVSVVLCGSTKSRLNQSIGHVADEEGLLEFVLRLESDMRQQVVTEDVLGKLDSLLLLLDTTLSALTIRLNEGNGSAGLSDVIKALFLGLVVFSLFDTGPQDIGHGHISGVLQHHIKDLLVVTAAKSSK